MSDLLAGNFEVKRKVESNEQKDGSAELKSEFRKKALESVGSSMVFVKREKHVWEYTDSEDGR